MAARPDAFEAKWLTRRRTLAGAGTLATGAVLTACAPSQPAPESAPTAPTVISGTPQPLATAARGVPTTGGVVPTPRDQTVIVDQAEFTVFDSFNPYIPNGPRDQAGVEPGLQASRCSSSASPPAS